MQQAHLDREAEAIAGAAALADQNEVCARYAGVLN